jgi:hypothetical protein
MSQYGAIDHADEESRCEPGTRLDNEHGSHCSNRRQVNDWNMSNGGTSHSEARQGQEVGRKRTGVDYKHDHRNHQDNPTLVRTQDPSPPYDDAVGDKKLSYVSGNGSVQGECFG